MVHLPHFTDEEMEAQRGEVACSGHQLVTVKQRSNSRVVRGGLCLQPILTLGHTLPRGFRAMHTSYSIGDHRQMWSVSQTTEKSCKYGQFQVKLLDLQFWVDDNIQLNLFVKELNGSQPRDNVWPFYEGKKNHSSWLIRFLSEDFTISCLKSTCQVLEEDLLTDLKGPRWDAGFVLIDIRLARKPGL